VTRVMPCFHCSGQRPSGVYWMSRYPEATRTCHPVCLGCRETLLMDSRERVSVSRRAWAKSIGLVPPNRRGFPPHMKHLEARWLEAQA